MKKNLMLFVLIILTVIGYATVNTALDIKNNINISENNDDFRIEITNLKINNNDNKNLISKDKQSFTFIGSGNDTINYTVTNYSYQYDANVILVCTPNDNIIIDQINNIPAQDRLTKSISSTNTKEITCTINIEKISRTDYAEEMCKIEEGTEWKFNYTGDEQEFVVPCDGNYKLELWGAQGGSTGECTGGFGAYSLGEIYLVERQIFINVGGSGIGGLTWEVKNGGYNGGGRAGVNSDTNSYNASGGGATHIAYSSGELNSLVNKRDDIIIVAGGGGGTGYNSAYGRTSKSGSGGGFVGVCSEPRYAPSIKKYMQGCGGTQTRGGEQITENIITLPEEAKSNLGAFGSFGQGGSGTSPWCGAGAGFFGGTNNGYVCGGGSGYIGNQLLKNKSMYCYNCKESNNILEKTLSTNCSSSTPTTNCAKQGHGYAKITYLGK